MMARHVTRDLWAFLQGELPAERLRRVEAHLEACERCRKTLEEMRFGVDAARKIRGTPAPGSLWAAVEERLDSSAAAAPPERWTHLVAASAVLALIAVVGSGVWYFGMRAPLEMRVASSEPTAFENAARQAHARRAAGARELDYTTDSPGALRDWLRHEGFDVQLAIQRPPGDEGRFQVVGAKVVQAGGARAALVEYEIDAHPVTLLTAPLREVTDPPDDMNFKKKVAYRFDMEHGVKMLTWGASGQAYVLVSDLPGTGTDACSICHTTPERRELIRKTRLQDTH
jgi:anti-sigma factor RsiW